MASPKPLELRTERRSNTSTSWTAAGASNSFQSAEITSNVDKKPSKKMKWIIAIVGVLLIGGVVLAVLLVTNNATNAKFEAPAPVLKIPAFKYLYTENQCVFQNMTKEEHLNGPQMGPGLMSLRVCEMTCGNGSMVPIPQNLVLGAPGETTAVDVSAFTHKVTGGNEALVKRMQDSFNEYILHKKKLAVGGIAAKGQSVKVIGNVASASTELTLDTDESYELSIDGTTATITANTVFGYRHGLASLQQLIDWCDITRAIRMVPKVSIKDKPVYKYRGTMLDTSRNFHTVESLKRLVRAMGQHKLNVFHWHITDSGAFPIEIKFEPKFNAYGNYQSEMAYSQAQVKDFVAYAKVHGVQVIPEIDAPAHAGAGWQWGPDYGVGDLTLCYYDSPMTDRCYQPPCGQLNPLNEKVYELLDGVWKEMTEMFEADTFHMGGDEVFAKCWQDSPVVANTLKDKKDKHEVFDIWAKFQERVQNDLWKRVPNKKILLWSSDLTTDAYFKFLPKDKVVVQSWAKPYDSNEPRVITDAGYQYIASFQDVHYLDCGMNGVDRKNNGWCSPYKTWQVIYEQELNPNITKENQNLVLGGEVGLWTEVTGEAAMDSRMWPRAAAFAERAWTNPSIRWDKFAPRLTVAAARMYESGIGSELVQPHWCRQRPGQCPLVVWPL